MRIAFIIVRILMGLMFLMASVTYFLHMFKQPEMTGSVKVFNDGIAASIYLMPLIKAVELVCGLCFVTGRFVKLAAVVIFPIIVNILCYHAFLAPKEVLIPVLLLLADLFIAYYYRATYAPLFAAK